MKLASDCYDCLKRLIAQAANLATEDASLRQKAVGRAMNILENEFSYDQMSIVLATKIHDVIKEVTGNTDPYRAIKEKEMAIVRELYSEIVSQYKGDMKDFIKLAAVANALDFFKEPGEVKEDIRKLVNFTIDDSDCLKEKLKGASEVLYLADNAGEVYFDLPLIKWMRRYADVTYVVKPSPVQNDVTIEDIRKAGLEDEFGRIITTGVASPGIVFDLASEEFKREFESADLIFAKGMGYYESLSELPKQGRFFYCLMAKCKPVARSLGVPVNSYVAMLC